MSKRRFGTLTSWFASEHGGYGYVDTANGNRYFLHRRFIRSGDPRPGSSIVFTTLPPATDVAKYPRAIDATINANTPAAREAEIERLLARKKQRQKLLPSFRQIPVDSKSAAKRRGARRRDSRLGQRNLRRPHLPVVRSQVRRQDSRGESFSGRVRPRQAAIGSRQNPSCLGSCVRRNSRRSRTPADRAHTFSRDQRTCSAFTQAPRRMAARGKARARQEQNVYLVGSAHLVTETAEYRNAYNRPYGSANPRFSCFSNPAVHMRETDSGLPSKAPKSTWAETAFIKHVQA